MWKSKLYKGFVIGFMLFNITFAIIGALVMLFGDKV